MYLYAITDQPETPVPAKPGLEDTSLLSLAYRDIAAVVSPLLWNDRRPQTTDGQELFCGRRSAVSGRFLDDGPSGRRATAEVMPTEDNLWQHEEVVEALMADRTVLPVRFGTMLADKTAVQSVLAAHYADFVASLDRVRGRVELGLRVLWNDRRPQTTDRRDSFCGRPPAVSGRSYLLARLEEERQVRAWRQRAEALATKLHAPLARLAAVSTRQVLVTPRLLLTAAYLVEQDQVTTFRGKVEALSTAYPALHFLCTGPWPAYSFVTTTVVMRET